MTSAITQAIQLIQTTLAASEQARPRTTPAASEAAPAPWPPAGVPKDVCEPTAVAEFLLKRAKNPIAEFGGHPFDNLVGLFGAPSQLEPALTEIAQARLLAQAVCVLRDKGHVDPGEADSVLEGLQHTFETAQAALQGMNAGLPPNDPLTGTIVLGRTLALSVLDRTGPLPERSKRHRTMRWG